MSHPKHEPTASSRRQVEALSAFGISDADIAAILDIGPKLLRKLYEEELELGETRASTRVAESLFRTAVRGGREGTTAAIFWLKTRAGWTEFNAPRLRPPSKKEFELEQAMNAGKGTDWEDLLS